MTGKAVVFSATDWFESRRDLRDGFLNQHGLSGAKLTPVGEDGAMRRYYRLNDHGTTRILMESLPDGQEHEKATAGHKISDFIRLSSWLRGQGLHAPEIYNADEKAGYVLLEDFGDLSFRQAFLNGHDAKDLYGTATDVLTCLRDARDVPQLPDYYQSAVHKGRRRVVDWYIPSIRRTKNPNGLAEDFLAVWDSIEKKLPPCPRGFLHIDYHFENLMLVSGAAGLQRCGLLDFQGAMNGPIPYDLANLLEDARVRVPADIRAAMLDRFCVGMKDADTFRAWYRVIATQFHCRVMGQFIRLAIVNGKPRYMQFLPIVGEYLLQGLEDPLLKPLKDWFVAQKIDFSSVPSIDPATIKSFIRDDAV